MKNTPGSSFEPIPLPHSPEDFEKNRAFTSMIIEKIYGSELPPTGDGSPLTSEEVEFLDTFIQEHTEPEEFAALYETALLKSMVTVDKKKLH